ncbi:MAG: hypothetical protein IJT59_02535 [Desulfovibrionaceae bacterium]|nr:hypothetical protein [Desulfovibrionaceae bacterium]
MCAKKNCHRSLLDNLSEPPNKSATLVIGPRFFVDAINQEYQLLQILNDVFGEEGAALILDLSMHLIFGGSLSLQHFPVWARRFYLYSNCTRSYSFISRFLSEKLTYSNIKLFCSKCAKLYVKDAAVFFCYGSVGANFQDNGMYITKNAYVNNSKTLRQVNIDYIIRQDDGLPLIFRDFPCEVVDIVDAQTMVNFIKEIRDQERYNHKIKACEENSQEINGQEIKDNAINKKEITHKEITHKEINCKEVNCKEVNATCNCNGNDKSKIIFVCDRGYIAQKGLLEFRKEDLGFLIMISNDMEVSKQLIKEYGPKIRFNFDHYIKEFDKFGITQPIYDFIEGVTVYFQIIYDRNLAERKYSKLNNKIKLKSKFLTSSVNRQEKFTYAEIEENSYWYDLEVEESGVIAIKSDNCDFKKVPTYIIKSFTANNDKINRSINECGFYILISSENITAKDAISRYAKLNSVDTVFRTFESSLVMDASCIDESLFADGLRGKTLISFIASILCTIIFNKTSNLSEHDNINYKMSDIIAAISAIECYMDQIS